MGYPMAFPMPTRPAKVLFLYHFSRKKAIKMRKKVTTLILVAVITAAVSLRAWACTPPLNVGNIWGDLTPPDEIEYTPSEDIDKACDNAAKKWLEEHPIDLAPAESETEIETETETAAETETVMPGKLYLDWAKYIPESFRNRWMSFVRR